MQLCTIHCSCFSHRWYRLHNWDWKRPFNRLGVSVTDVHALTTIPTQELAAKKVDRAIVLAMGPYLIEVLAYLHEFRVQNLLHSHYQSPYP